MRKIVFGLLLVLLSAAAFGKGKPEQYVYLFDLVKKQPYKAVWQKDIWQQVKRQSHGMNVAWVNGANGVSSPVETVRIGGRKYYLATLCEPHNCGVHMMYVLFDSRKAVAMRQVDLDEYVYHGNPDRTLRDYLDGWRKAEMKKRGY